MSKGLHEGLRDLADEIGTVEPDLAAIERRGRRRRYVRYASTTVTIALNSAPDAVPLYRLTDLRKDRAVADPIPSEAPTGGSSDEVVEEMTEQQQAEVFAVRAVAATGLMDPYGERSYLFASDDTRNEDGWRVGFAASDCEPRESEGGGYSHTCRGLSGEDHAGNALTDTFVSVNLRGGTWHVVDVEGNMRAEDRHRLIGFELPQIREASHWEFPAVGTWSTDEGFEVTMVELWVGAFPTSALGSVCDVRALDASNEVIATHRFYLEPPTEQFQRAGGHLSPGLSVSLDPARIDVECRQYTGSGWEVSSQPTMMRADGTVRGVQARLRWTGDEGFTAAAVCHVTLVDPSGEVVEEGEGHVYPLWRPEELSTYPYETDVYIVFGPEGVRGVEIGEFTCTTV